jgi:hypothetical protein
VPQGVQVRVLFPAPEFDSCGWKIEVPRLRSGFRLRAPPFGKLRVTPAKRLKFESCSRHQSDFLVSQSYFSTWNGTLLVRVPLGVVTVTYPVVAPAGTVALM